MAGSAGLVFIRLDVGMDRHMIETTCNLAEREVAPGRYMAVCWRVPHAWIPQPPVEAWVTHAILGPLGSPEGDEEHGGSEFFGNLVVRGYRDPGLEPSATLHVLMFRKQGALPYKRRNDPSAPLASDLLDAVAPVFTRDVSNNTWHLLDDDLEYAVMQRLSTLVRWSDEPVVEFSGSARIERSGRLEAAEPTMIGVAERTPYEWRSANEAQLLLALTVDPT